MLCMWCGLGGVGGGGLLEAVEWCGRKRNNNYGHFQLPWVAIIPVWQKDDRWALHIDDN